MSESEDITTIQIEKTTWKKLNRMKEPGETFDDIISKLLKEGE